ncbi:hypothetical protein [Alkalicoccus chagannorensis]|uniref:hypothetical protein n=1 Tax=Alkalicoccus chagannorensis TaxID=427072 RepID=UPI00047B79D3|nr:hypothetical protein [Alkalicoccus chagannorensis]
MKNAMRGTAAAAAAGILAVVAVLASDSLYALLAVSGAVMLAAGAVMLVMLVKTSGAAVPTVYGTSKPNSMTTVSRAEGSGEAEEDRGRRQKLVFWGVLLGWMILLFFAGVIALQPSA